MPAITSITLDNARLDDVATRLKDLDPGQRYEVTIRRARARADIATDIARLSETVSRRARAGGLTADDVADALEMDETEKRNLLD